LEATDVEPVKLMDIGGMLMSSAGSMMNIPHIAHSIYQKSPVSPAQTSPESGKISALQDFSLDSSANGCSMM